MKNLIYAFGPDGAGKSTVASCLSEVVPHMRSLNASRPDTWPDKSWSQEITDRGLDPNTLDPAFHTESIRRCYRVANGLLQLPGISTVLIDSDLRTKAAVKASAWYGHSAALGDIYGQLCSVTDKELASDVQQTGLHVTVAGSSSSERAAILLDRISDRGEASFYDPASAEQAQTLLKTFDSLETVLSERNEPWIRVETNRPYDPSAIAGQLAILER